MSKLLATLFFDQLTLLIGSYLNITLQGYRRSAKLQLDVVYDNLSNEKRNKIIELRDTFDRIFRKVIHRGVEAGYFSAIDEKLAGFMIASMITRARIWFHPKKGVSIEELADFVTNFSIHGLIGKKIRR